MMSFFFRRAVARSCSKSYLSSSGTTPPVMLGDNLAKWAPSTVIMAHMLLSCFRPMLCCEPCEWQRVSGAILAMSRGLPSHPRADSSSLGTPMDSWKMCCGSSSSMGRRHPRTNISSMATLLIEEATL